tara:strand:+ start:619 stop:885 length:267 start_codon:yes stop_codon:yes gene_type:complete
MAFFKGKIFVTRSKPLRKSEKLLLSCLGVPPNYYRATAFTPQPTSKKTNPPLRYGIFFSGVSGAWFAFLIAIHSHKFSKSFFSFLLHF